MKKIVRVFLLVVCCMTLGGCRNKAVVSDVSSIRYLDASTQSNIAHNLSNVAKQIKSAGFEGSVLVKDKEYYFSGEIIFGNHYEDSLLHIKYEKNEVYVKNKNVYVSSSYKGINFVIKDTVDNFSKEICDLLNNKGIKCKNDVVFDVLKNKNLNDLDFDDISKHLNKEENGFVVDYNEFKVELSELYLPETVTYVKGNLNVNMSMKYVPIKIEVPLGYNILNVSLDEVIDLLGVEDFSALFE